MNTKVWYLPYFEGVYHTRMIETFSSANAHMVCMVHTMIQSHNCFFTHRLSLEGFP